MKPSVLITGAYGGMGKATAKALKDRGFRVFALNKLVHYVIDMLCRDAGTDLRASDLENFGGNLAGTTHQINFPL